MSSSREVRNSGAPPPKKVLVDSPMKPGLSGSPAAAAKKTGLGTTGQGSVVTPAAVGSASPLSAASAVSPQHASPGGTPRVSVKEAIDMLLFGDLTSTDVKRLVFELQGIITNYTEFAEEFLDRAGLQLIVDLVKKAQGSSVQGHLLLVLKCLLNYVNAIEAVKEQPELVDKIYYLLSPPSDGAPPNLTVVKATLEVLIVLVHVLPNGRELVHDAAKRRAGPEQKPYSLLAPYIGANDLLCVRNALLFMNVLLRKAKETSEHEAKNLVFKWKESGILNLLKPLTSVEDQTVKQQLSAFQKMSEFVIPRSWESAEKYRVMYEEMKKRYEGANEALFVYQQQQAKVRLLKLEFQRAQETLKLMGMANAGASRQPHPTKRFEHGGGLSIKALGENATEEIDINQDAVKETTNMRKALLEKFLTSVDIRNFAEQTLGVGGGGGGGGGGRRRGGGSYFDPAAHLYDDDPPPPSDDDDDMLPSDDDSDFDLPPEDEDDDDLPPGALKKSRSGKAGGGGGKKAGGKAGGGGGRRKSQAQDLPPTDDEDDFPDDDEFPPDDDEQQGTGNNKASNKSRAAAGQAAAAAAIAQGMTPEHAAQIAAAVTSGQDPAAATATVQAAVAAGQDPAAALAATAAHTPGAAATAVAQQDAAAAAAAQDPAAAAQQQQQQQQAAAATTAQQQPAAVAATPPMGGPVIGAGGMPPIPGKAMPAIPGKKMPALPGAKGMPRLPGQAGAGGAAGPAERQWFKGTVSGKKMKPLHWDKIALKPEQLAGTIWHTIHEGDLDAEFDYGEFEGMFSQKEVEKKEEKKKEEKLMLVDPKTYMNFSIMLHKLPPIPTIQSAISELDSQTLKKDQIQSLLAASEPKALPPDTIKEFRAKQHMKPVEEYSPPEQFVAMVLSMGDIFKPRLSAWVFTMSWKESMDTVRAPLARASTVMESVLASKFLPYFLAILLGFGNLMNHGGTKGNAPAIMLSCLGKIDAAKDNRGKTSLMQHLLNTVRQRKPEALDLSEELKCLWSENGGAAGLKLDDMEKSVSEAEGAMNQFTAHCNAVKRLNADNPMAGSDPFLPMMTTYATTAATELAEAKQLLEAAKAKYKEIIKYFGYPERRAPKLDELMSELASFIGKVRKVADDAQKDKRKASRKGQKLDGKGLDNMVGQLQEQIVN